MDKMNENIMRELKRADDLCGKDILTWLASLYDAESGGFYYSISARDTDGFLPDLESTYQAVYLLQQGGMYGSGPVPTDIMPKIIADKFSEYAISLQSEKDGYFYHPQWGENVATSRKARDLMWARGLINKFGGSPKYLYPEQRIAELKKTEEGADTAEEDNNGVEERFTSEKKFREYLESLDFEVNGWGAGNTLVCQQVQIKAAGFSEMVVDYLAEKQNKETGLWGTGLSYANTNAAMKISGWFSSNYMPYPNLDKMVESVIYIVKNENLPIYITDVWNPIVAINQAKASHADFSPQLRSKLDESLAEVIRISVDNAKLFKKLDGAFGYNRLTGQKSSQGAIVSTGVNESDVNATLAACVSMRASLYSLAGVKAPPIYDKYAGYFMQLLLDKINALNK